MAPRTPLISPLSLSPAAGAYFYPHLSLSHHSPLLSIASSISRPHVPFTISRASSTAHSSYERFGHSHLPPQHDAPSLTSTEASETAPRPSKRKKARILLNSPLLNLFVNLMLCMMINKLLFISLETSVYTSRRSAFPTCSSSAIYWRRLFHYFLSFHAENKLFYTIFSLTSYLILLYYITIIIISPSLLLTLHHLQDFSIAALLSQDCEEEKGEPAKSLPVPTQPPAAPPAPSSSLRKRKKQSVDEEDTPKAAKCSKTSHPGEESLSLSLPHSISTEVIVNSV